MDKFHLLQMNFLCHRCISQMNELIYRVSIRKCCCTLLDRAGSRGCKMIILVSTWEPKPKDFCDNEHFAFSALVFSDQNWRCPGPSLVLIRYCVLYKCLRRPPVNRKVKLLLKLVSSLLHETRLLSYFLLHFLLQNVYSFLLFIQRLISFSFCFMILETKHYHVEVDSLKDEKSQNFQLILNIKFQF
jgi:hypothetical protein